MLDPWELALSLCGGLILLGVAIGRWMDQRVPHAKAHKADDIYQERRVIRNR